MKSYTIYTDGSCLKNPGGPGGFACIIIDDSTNQIIANKALGEYTTTNNRMELEAAILGLKYFKTKSKITLITDSTYVRSGFEKGWVEKWKKNNWKNSLKQDVKNRDLWEDLLSLVETHDVKFIWVRGHDTNKYNNMVDAMARDKAIEISLTKRY